LVSERAIRTEQGAAEYAEKSTFIMTGPAVPRVHEMAIRTARRCRSIIQAILREEERGDADREFSIVVREELERFLAERGRE
jgi:hypothetical protein